VDLNDAVRRVFLVHRKLIFLCVVLGLMGGLAVTAIRPATFTAAARLTLGQGTGVLQDPVAVADAAEGLVTSRVIIENAVQAAGPALDPVDVASDSISVKTLGSSDLVQLEVTDTRPAVASALANALGEELVNRWPDVSGGRSLDALQPLQDEISHLSERVTKAEQAIALLDIRIAQETHALAAEQLKARRDVLSQNRDELAQRRSLLESQLNGVLVAGASQRAPQVIDPAVPPTVADPKHRASAGALGALLGLLIGICVAALLESFRPTLAGSDAIADALGVPMLGELPTNVEGRSEEIRRSALKVRFAATTVRAKTIELVSIGKPIDLSPLSDSMDELDVAAGPRLSSANGGKNNGRMSVHRFGVDPERMRSTGTNAKADSALVAVVPSTIKRSDLRELGDIQALTSWPLVGVVTHDRPKRKIRHRAQPALQPRSADAGKVDLSQHAG
jgi:capsular polysaccharide biosynthesis protein